MSCCAPGAELDLHNAGPSVDEILLASKVVGDGMRRSDLSVPDMHCGACLHKIETALGRLDGVSEARANLSARRVSVLWRGEAPPPMIAALDKIGYAAHLFDALPHTGTMPLGKKPFLPLPWLSCWRPFCTGKQGKHRHKSICPWHGCLSGST